MKKITVLLLLSFFTLKSFSQDTTRYAHARQLLNLMGSGQMGIQMMNRMVESFKTSMPNVPVAFWDDFMKEVNTGEVVEMVVPVYVKYYAEEDILQLIEFYKSPIGQKVVKNSPMIVSDSYAIGAAWGKNIAEKVIERLKEKGYN
jgi:hypothetical protein